VVLDKRESSEHALTSLRWGSPPLALIPSVLAVRLAGVRLPDWLAEVLDGPGASAAALTASAWERLSDEEAVRDGITRYVLDLVARHVEELHDVLIRGRVSRSLAALGLARWPTRSRNALLRSGVGHDPRRLASLTFGELLDVRQIGVRTALEATALLELCITRAANDSGDDRLTIPEPPVRRSIGAVRWGEPGSPLLPQTLRRAFADEALPPWLVRDLHLPDDATALALDSRVWRHLGHLPPRVERFLIGLVTYRAADIRDLRVMEGAWPPDLRPCDVPWPTRVHNSLARAQLLDPAHLETVTYGELLAIPAVGVKTVLEFAVIADTVAVAAPALVLNEEARTELMAASEEEWAERVRADDPRFRDVAPPHQGSLGELFEEALNSPEGARAHAIAASLPGIRARAEEIAAQPIDVALAGFLKSLGTSDRNLGITAARLGWGASGPQTLQEVGDEFSMTRERVRQIVSRTVNRLGRTYLPQIEHAVQLLTNHAPLTATEAAQLLADRGLSTIPFHPISLETVAELLGYEVTFRVDPGDGSSYVLARGVTGTGPVFSVARREAGRVGVSNIDEVQAELETRGQLLSADAVSRILRSSARVQFLSDDWFWMPDIPPERNRLRNVTRRILSVAPRIDVASVRQGVRRRYRFVRIDLVPPVAVLAAFYDANPEFVVYDDGTVESAKPLDYRDTLGEAEQVMVEVLRASPTGLMDRAEFEEAVTERGVNPSTFSVFTTYSPVLDHPATNIWSLRGHVADPAQLEALRAILATRSRHRRTLAYGWDEDGSLRLTVDIGNVGSPVIGIPSAITRYVAGRRFQANTQEGMPAGIIAVDEGGASWGYGPFLRRRGADPGDSLTMRFDLVDETVTLSLDDDTALIEETS